MRLIFSALLMIAAAQAAGAATPSAWLSLESTARKVCGHEITRLASKAKVHGVTGRISGIGAAGDADRYYALVLDGRTAGFPSQWLCLYDKRVKTAVAREIEKR
jgi:hypothetical protein